MITVYTGLPGSGKSAKSAATMLQILKRNVKYFKTTGQVRYVYSNLKLSDALSKLYAKYIRYWADPEELVELKDCDVFWDEIATHLDSTQWQNLPLAIKRWLQQHRKRGVDIYANTQTFATIDKSFRRLTGECLLLRKIIGSRDPSPTKPEVKFIWGIILERHIDPQNYKEDETENRLHGWWFSLIDRTLIEAFDTRQPILMGKYPPLHHIVRSCIEPNCNFERVVHQ